MRDDARRLPNTCKTETPTPVRAAESRRASLLAPRIQGWRVAVAAYAARDHLMRDQRADSPFSQAIVPLLPFCNSTDD